MKVINVVNIEGNTIKYITPYKAVAKWEMAAQDNSTIRLAKNILSVIFVI
ncbi:hypothetical protein [uncultured Flavobacterium sp.]|nr:hypothetical protein [uncultured Flavobacterium sp.]